MKPNLTDFPKCIECPLWNKEKERCEQTYGYPCPKGKWLGKFKKALLPSLEKALRRMFSESDTQMILSVIQEEVLGE